jgi:methylthioribose-1-phosphate isomerase
LIDQRALPGRLSYVDCRTPGEVVAAIRKLVVRGAPAIGAAGAYGVVLAARGAGRRDAVRRAAARIAAARPTAVNLERGVDAALAGFEAGGPPGALEAAHAFTAGEVAACRAIGTHGLELVPEGTRVVTHCNAGGLATIEYGTALGPVRAAHDAGRHVLVWVDETRPVLQGARLTAWELDRLGIEHRVIADGAAAALMAAGEVDLVLVGADRIARNGDVANKLGTYGLAVVARAHGIPFVVAAPESTVDRRLATGAGIPIEERDEREVLHAGGVRVTPARSGARNPAFDVTPARLVSAIVTERGVHRAPYRRSLAD